MVARRYSTNGPMTAETAEMRNLIEKALRKGVIDRLSTARRCDEVRTMMDPAKWVSYNGEDPNQPLPADPVYTEEQFLAMELLGHHYNNVDVELVYSFLMYMGAERVRPNTFIHQWAQWRRNHTGV